MVLIKVDVRIGTDDDDADSVEECWVEVDSEVLKGVVEVNEPDEESEVLLLDVGGTVEGVCDGVNTEVNVYKAA